MFVIKIDLLDLSLVVFNLWLMWNYDKNRSEHNITVVTHGDHGK